MAAKKCRLMEATGSKRGSVSTSSSNFSLVARIEMSGGWILRPVAGSTVSTCPLKTTVLTMSVRGDREYLADRAYRDLGDHGVVEALRLRRGPGDRLDGLARLDVPERLVLGDDVEGRQEPLDRQQRRLGHVPGVPLGGETFGVGRPVQHHLHVLADGEPVRARGSRRRARRRGRCARRPCASPRPLLLVHAARAAAIPRCLAASRR